MDPSEAKCVYDDHRDCADGICLSSAIARHNRILMESTSPDDPGAEESLKYIIHFISDVCQPLHTDGREKGGSLTVIHFGGKRWTLHTMWDKHIPEKRVRVDFQGSEALYANYLIESIKTGENKVPSKSWTSKLPIDAVNDIGNSMVAIDYTADSYELSCSVIWPEYNTHRERNLGKKYYDDFFKTVDIQISKAGLRVANWLNKLARLHSQAKVEAATLPAAQPGKSNIEKHPSPPRESMSQSKKDPSMSSKQLVSGAQKLDDPPMSSKQLVSGAQKLDDPPMSSKQLVSGAQKLDDPPMSSKQLVSGAQKLDDPPMSSKQLASGAQKPDDPPPSQSDHDDHQVADDDATEWQVVKKKRPRSDTATTKGKGGNLSKGKKGGNSPKGKGATRQSKQ
ncbi:hypothetical protein BASA83_003295 [Batrachochytrium salamandrivorans]|nr:hypothetical protein BASA83_003295 [Batrachochytrium salamandrivorans]